MISDLVDTLIEGRRRDLGGFEVERILPSPSRRMVGPFIFLDHMGPAVFAPGGGIDVRPHPHIGLSTVTYLFEGEIVHRDSLGFTETIRPGEVNWMTAGAGITHSERTDPARRAAGGASHGMQAWVALPDSLETCPPSFSHHGPEDLPTYEGGGLWARLIAGEAFGAKSKAPALSPLFYVHWRLQPGARAQLDATYPERAAFIVQGAVEVDGRVYKAGQLLILSQGQPVVFQAVETAQVMLLGGESVGERYIWWNLVSSSKDRIEAAKADWSAGRMALPPEDFADVIPLPLDPPPEAQPL